MQMPLVRWALNTWAGVLIRRKEDTGRPPEDAAKGRRRQRLGCLIYKPRKPRVAEPPEAGRGLTGFRGRVALPHLDLGLPASSRGEHISAV